MQFSHDCRKTETKVITELVTSASLLPVSAIHEPMEFAQWFIRFHKPMMSKSENHSSSYFEIEMAWDKPKKIPHSVSLVNLIYLLNPCQYPACFSLVE